MTKPKYRLGDLIRDYSTWEVELIVEIYHTCDMYRYKTVYMNGFSDGTYDDWCESTINDYYVVIGNIFEGDKHD